MDNKGGLDIRSEIQGRISLLGCLGGIRCGTLSRAVVLDVDGGFLISFSDPDQLSLLQLDILIRRNSLN